MGLRFLFIQTLDRPDLARRLVRLAHPRNLPVVLSRDEVSLNGMSAEADKYKLL